ncbi:MAG: hypothetical protein WC989_03750 [Micavibrio sp.]
MDEIEQRLRESTATFIKNFEGWAKDQTSADLREGLMDSMHEVRRVLARVEIEIAISERDRMGSRQLPIPPHRSQKKRGGEGGGDDAGSGDDGGFNMLESDGAEQPRQPRRVQSRGGRRPQTRGNNNTGNGEG